MKSYKSIDEYITNFTPEQQAVLTKLRQTIHTVAPEAVEKISYGIPTFVQQGPLIHFAAYDSHYAIYPGAAAIEVFRKELEKYDTSKGTVRFPVDKPIPYDLVEKITTFCLQNK